MREVVSMKLSSAWISTLESPFNPAASDSLILQGLECAFCSAALLSSVHASINNMRMPILTTTRATGHLRHGTNPYNPSLCFDLNFRCESPKKLQRVTTRSNYLFTRTGGN